MYLNHNYSISVGFATTLALMPYSARFHAIRRLVHKELTGNALKKYEPLHEQESRSLIKAILQDPPCLRDAIRR